jgi:RNA polymerase sigma factor (sigma-70 family)
MAKKKRVGWEANEIANLLLVTRMEHSLNVPATPGSDDTLLDMMPADDDWDPMEQFHHHSFKKYITSLLDVLDDRQRDVIERRYGSCEQTLEAIGEHLDLSREHVRRIQNHALERMLEAVRAHDLSWEDFFS